MKQNLFALGLALVLSAGLSTAAMAEIVAGKIVAVQHESVQVDKTWLDKISVFVDSCSQPGTIETVVYSPATVSDEQALGHLFEQTLASGRSPNMLKQNMPNGYGLFWTDANKTIQRTGILGHKVSCTTVQSLVDQFK